MSKIFNKKLFITTILPERFIYFCHTTSSSKDATEVEEIKANKQPIGKFDHPQPFMSHTVELQKGDTIYIFSDGFADQFGGQKGKKFKTANMKRLLLSIQNKSMEEQRVALINTFEEWKGGLEQVDDVCLIGVKL